MTQLQLLFAIVAVSAVVIGQRQKWDNGFDWSKMSKRIDDLEIKQAGKDRDEADRNWRRCCQGRGLIDACVDLCKHGAITQPVVRFCLLYAPHL